MGDIVGRTDFIQKHAAVSIFAAMGHPDHRIAGMLIDDSGQLFGNFFERLVPGDRLKLTVRAPLHGLSDSVLVIQVGSNAMGSGAKRAKIFHGLGMPFHFPQTSVFDVGKHRTGRGAAVAIRGHFRHRRIGNGSTECLHVHKLRNGNSCCCGSCRYLQESSSTDVSHPKSSFQARIVIGGVRVICLRNRTGCKMLLPSGGGRTGAGIEWSVEVGGQAFRYRARYRFGADHTDVACPQAHSITHGDRIISELVQHPGCLTGGVTVITDYNDLLSGG